MHVVMGMAVVMVMMLVIMISMVMHMLVVMAMLMYMLCTILMNMGMAVVMVMYAVCAFFMAVVMGVVVIPMFMVMMMLMLFIFQMHIKIICLDAAFLRRSKMQMIAVYSQTCQCIFQYLSVCSQIKKRSYGHITAYS